MFTGLQAIKKHKVLLFAKVPSFNQAYFPLPLYWKDKHMSFSDIWHLLWLFLHVKMTDS